MHLKIHPKDKMTPLERERAISENKDYDRIIMDPFLGDIKARIIGKNIADYWSDANNLLMGDVEAMNRFGLDIMDVGPNLYGIAEAMGAVLHYPEHGYISVKNRPIHSMDEVSKLKDITKDSGRMAMYYNANAKLREIADGFCRVCTSLSGPITLVGLLLGTDNLLREMVSSSDKLHIFLRYITENIKYMVDIFAGLDIDFAIADPIASCTVISPQIYLEFAYPYTLEISSYIREKSGKAPTYHVCGNTKQVWKYIKNLGIGIFSVDNKMDIDETCDFFSDSNKIAGNVDSVSIICHGTKTDIENEVKRCIRAGRKCKKGFILTPGCNLPLDTTDEKIDMFLDAGRKYSFIAK